MFRGVRCAPAAPIAPAALVTVKRAICRTLYKSKPTNAPRLVASAVMGQLTTSVGYCAYCLTDVAAWTVQGVQEAAGMPLGAVLLSSALLAGARFTLRSMLEEAQFDGNAGLLHIKHHSLWGPKPIDIRVTDLAYVGQAVTSKDISVKLKSGQEFIGTEMYLGEADSHTLRFLHQLTQDDQAMRKYAAIINRPAARLMDLGRADTDAEEVATILNGAGGGAPGPAAGSGAAADPSLRATLHSQPPRRKGKKGSRRN